VEEDTDTGDSITYLPGKTVVESLRLSFISLPPSLTVPATHRYILQSTVLLLLAPVELLGRMGSR